MSMRCLAFIIVVSSLCVLFIAAALLFPKSVHVPSSSPTVHAAPIDRNQQGKLRSVVVDDDLSTPVPAEEENAHEERQARLRQSEDMMTLAQAATTHNSPLPPFSLHPPLELFSIPDPLTAASKHIPDVRRAACAYIAQSFPFGYYSLSSSDRGFSALIPPSDIDSAVTKPSAEWKSVGCYQSRFTVEEPVLFTYTMMQQRTVGVSIVARTGKVIDAPLKYLLASRFELEWLFLSMARGALPQMMTRLRQAHQSTTSSTRLPGDVIVVHLPWRGVFGQLLQHFMDQMARIYTSGLLSSKATKTTILLTTDVSSSIDRAMTEWIRPYLDGVKLIAAQPDAVYNLAQRTSYVVSLHTEAMAPCIPLFVRHYLLPRIINRFCTDRSMMMMMMSSSDFPYGDAALLSATKSSDDEEDRKRKWKWFSSLPKKIYIIKQLKKESQSLHKSRSFPALSNATQSLLAASGFVAVSDALALDKRLLLVNAAEVIVTTFGALLAILSRLHGGSGGGDSTTMKRREASRWIVLCHQGYHEEVETWSTPRKFRSFLQDGVEVKISNDTVLTPPHNWVKFVKILNLDRQLTQNHLQFPIEECHLDGDTAKTMQYDSKQRDKWFGAAALSESDVPSRRKVPGFSDSADDQCL